MAHVARELGVNDKTLGGWVSDYRRKNAVGRRPMTCRSRTGSGNLNGGTGNLRPMLRPKKSCRVLREGAAVSEKYSFIDAEYEKNIAGNADNAPTVVQMCHWLYEWRSRPQSAADKRRELLKIKVKAAFEANNEEYGYRRVHQTAAPKHSRARRKRPSRQLPPISASRFRRRR